MTQKNQVGVCQDGFIGKLELNILIPGTGSFLLGLTRISALGLLLINDWRNRITLRKKSENSLHIARGLVLPSYFACIYSLMFIDAISGIIDIIFSLVNIGDAVRTSSDTWILSIECGAFHCITEGLAIFLMRYGAGTQAFRYSLRLGLLWGIITATVFKIELDLLSNLSINDEGKQWSGLDPVYSIFVVYCGILFIFYGLLMVLPQSILYKRPALKIYAAFNIVLNLFWIIAATIVRFDSLSTICGSSIAGLILVAIFQPIIVWITLQRDSQYWQGMRPDEGNPMALVWDQIDIETATSMSEVLTSYESDRKFHVPLLHFGLIKLDQTLGFISGGFSRVYFGRIGNDRVALKVMFAIELTASDVKEFFREAKLLQILASKNVVKCLGVCVMPPAVTIVLEYCTHGSLFDFIHRCQQKDIPALSSGSHKNSTIISDSSSTNPMNQSIVESRVSWGIANPNVIPPNRDIAWNVYEHSDNSSLYSASHSNSLYGECYSTSDRSSIGYSQKPIRSGQTEIPRNGSVAPVSSFEKLNIEAVSTTHLSSTKPSFTRELSWRPNESIATAAMESVKASDATAPSISRPTALTAAAAKKLSNLVAAGLSFRKRSTKQFGDISLLPPAFGLPYTTRFSMMLDMIQSIEYLHKKGYMHCDIKSLNFLVAENYVLKLSDMGETRHVDSPPLRERPPIPARNWAPPEVLPMSATAEVYTMKSDIYGLSICLAELLTLSLPFGDDPELMTQFDWYDKLTVEGVRPRLPSNLSPSLKNILDKGWSTDPSKRPTATEIFEAFDSSLEAGTSQIV